MNHYTSEPKEKNIVDKSALMNIIANAQKSTMSNKLSPAPPMQQADARNQELGDVGGLFESREKPPNDRRKSPRADFENKKAKDLENESPDKKKEREIAQKLRKVLLRDLATSLRHVKQHPCTQQDPESMDVIRNTPQPVAAAMLDWINAREAKKGAFVL